MSESTIGDMTLDDMRVVLKMSPALDSMSTVQFDAFIRCAGWLARQEGILAEKRMTELVVEVRYVETEGTKIEQIKHLRTISGLGLKEAKDAVESRDWVKLPKPVTQDAVSTAERAAMRGISGTVFVRTKRFLPATIDNPPEPVAASETLPDPVVGSW